MKVLSLCLATNGVGEWVFPVLDNIYNEDISEEEWEIIVTDNGSNELFFRRMQTYSKKHTNLVYKRTNAYMFENQIEALRLASGQYLKFINHRSILESGAISWMIELVKTNIEDKPIMYLSNGVLKLKEPKKYGSFDAFVREIREYASWTTGVGVWKSDFDKIPLTWKYNSISPHSDVLFWIRDRASYYVDDRVWCRDIDQSHANKGKYDLYRAFAIEEISITLGLLNDRSISIDTFKYIVKCYEKCVSSFYLQFSILHHPCSYLLDGFDDAMGIFLSKRRVLLRAYLGIPKMFFLKMYYRIVGK